MAGNTRGKIKEHVEGIHKNFDWIEYHCDKTVTLIAGKKPNLTDAILSLRHATQRLDKLVQGLYSQL